MRYLINYRIHERKDLFATLIQAENENAAVTEFMDSAPQGAYVVAASPIGYWNGGRAYSAGTKFPVYHGTTEPVVTISFVR